ncbi:N-acetyl sugar amidotransferase [bacterium]|nr:N-acetyl sugar amidotransferase [bacterium]
MAVPFLDQDGPYCQCSLSLHDTIADPDIEFDDRGVSIYHYYYEEAKQRHNSLGACTREQLNGVAEDMVRAGRGRSYDCLIGLSGGVDSAYAALTAKQLGLRPLAVHLDNGWNSEIAVKNIENIVNRLGIDLYTHVIDWEEFRDLQLAYLRASVVDIEVLTDHAILAILFRQAVERKVKYIINGCNVQTENILPWSWVHPKGDHVNIRAIHKAYSKVPLKTFPLLDFKLKSYGDRFKPVKHLPILNYLDYNKEEVKSQITEQLGWCDYGGKHYESVWTRFYQGYILPKKFRIDKRKSHLSSLIFDGQLTKEAAQRELETPIYDPTQFNLDYDFVLKKLELTQSQFEEIMRQPRRSHYEFDYEMPLAQRYPILKPVKKLYRSLFPQKK